jgi:hypothetical protein
MTICRSPQDCQASYLLIPVDKIHETLMVVVVMRALGCISGQQKVVRPQAVALCVSVREDARLQELVIRIANTCKTARDQVKVA